MVTNLVVSGKVEGRRATGHQRLKYLDSSSTCWKDNVSPTQLVRASEDTELWLHTVANVIYDGMVPLRKKEVRLCVWFSNYTCGLISV